METTAEGSGDHVVTSPEATIHTDHIFVFNPTTPLGAYAKGLVLMHGLSAIEFKKLDGLKPDSLTPGDLIMPKIPNAHEAKEFQLGMHVWVHFVDCQPGSKKRAGTAPNEWNGATCFRHSNLGQFFNHLQQKHKLTFCDSDIRLTGYISLYIQAGRGKDGMNALKRMRVPKEIRIWIADTFGNP